MFTLHLVDTNIALVDAWRQAFLAWPEVAIENANILQVAANTIVSPANSYGLMDGGLDDRYIDFFGPGLQRTVLAAIDRRPEGHLPVGAGLLVPTSHPRIPYLIVAPTMLLPGPVSPDNSYWAMSALLKVAAANPSACSSVYCPGLATGVGCVPPSLAAERMEEAYSKWRAKNPLSTSSGAA